MSKTIEKWRKHLIVSLLLATVKIFVGHTILNIIYIFVLYQWMYYFNARTICYGRMVNQFLMLSEWGLKTTILVQCKKGKKNESNFVLSMRATKKVCNCQMLSKRPVVFLCKGFVKYIFSLLSLWNRHHSFISFKWSTPNSLWPSS